MAIACIAIVFVHHTSLIWRFEIAGIPLAWVAGGITTLSILAYELCNSAAPSPRAKPRQPEPNPARRIDLIPSSTLIQPPTSKKLQPRN
jgi:hypothetical protein